LFSARKRGGKNSGEKRGGVRCSLLVMEGSWKRKLCHHLWLEERKKEKTEEKRNREERKDRNQIFLAVKGGKKGTSPSISCYLT